MVDIKKTPNILLIGRGNMGGNMLESWVESCQSGQLSMDIHVVDRHIDPAGIDAFAARNVTIMPTLDVQMLRKADVVVLAVKPQGMDDLCHEIAGLYAQLPDSARQDSVFLSVAAGHPIIRFASILGDETPIIRAMPNTPCAVNQGVTFGVCNAHVNAAQRSYVDDILSVMGYFAWLDSESDLDKITPFSGCGPAYFFYIFEIMQDIAMQWGLPPEIIRPMIIQTAKGACELALSKDLDGSAASDQASATATEFAQLRKNVTSPGGVTEQALRVLMDDDGLKRLIDQALQAGLDRARDFR